jgi:uncharacterized repeat protein (TIGR01451 family)
MHSRRITTPPVPSETKNLLLPIRNLYRPFRHLPIKLMACSILMMMALSVISFSVSSAPSRNFPSMLNAGSVFSPLFVPQASLPETVETFESDCTTTENVYILGETICAVATNAPAPFLGVKQRRFQWISPNGQVVRHTDITTSPQSDSFTVPTTGPLAQVGTWTVRLIKNNGSTVTLTRFVVRDPNNLRVDLSVSKFGPLEVKSGSNASYSISLINRGPDDAQNVVLTDPTPNGLTFVSATQNSGPAFTCTDPAAGCTIANMPRNSTANFTFVYEVNSSMLVGDTINNTVEVTSATVELNPADNTYTAPSTVTGAAEGGAECVISCPGDITVVAGPGESGKIVEYPDPTTTGSNCGAISCSQASGTFFAVGTTVVVCAAESGDPCSFSVTVEDNEDPTIDCPDNIVTAETTPGSGSAIVNYSVDAQDNSGFVEVTCTKPSGSSFPVGTTTVTCTAADEAGNDASCSFTVQVTGDGCGLTCPENITVVAPDGECSAVVNYPAPTGEAECGEITVSHASGSTFPLGTTTVTVNAASGSTCSFTVTVLDHQAPTFTSCPNSITVDVASGACAATVNPGTATAEDSCSTVTVVGTRNDGEPISSQQYRVGTTIITWTATDAAGNSASCEQAITVRDPIPPTVSVSVPNNVANANADENCQALVPNLRPYLLVSDNCTPVSNLIITQSPAAETPVGAGVHTITITVIEGDPEGVNNTVTVTTPFTVHDVTPPVLTVVGDNPLVVECHTNLTDPGATATDNCGATVTSTNNVNMNVPGNYTITYTATDGTNSVTATRAVTVVDTIAPVITLNGPNPMTVECHTSFTDPGATATDSCAGNLTVTATGTVNVNVPGTYTRTYTATDGANHTTTVTRTVNVVDTTAPVITLTGATINLWPPNHKYQTINLTQLVAGASDGCDGGVDINDVVITKVTSDEAENSGGDGNTLNDIVIAANCKSVQLRSERNGSGNGRVYTIHFRVTDASGNVGTKTAKVSVPKSQGNGGAAVDDGPQYTVNSSCQ